MAKCDEVECFKEIFVDFGRKVFFLLLFCWRGLGSSRQGLRWRRRLGFSGLGLRWRG